MIKFSKWEIDINNEATGTGKPFTIANVIEKVNKPTLVLAHNKTLAGQLYAELKEFFPNNHVEDFVSYYDVSTFPMLSSIDKSTKIGLNKMIWTR